MGLLHMSIDSMVISLSGVFDLSTASASFSSKARHDSLSLSDPICPKIVNLPSSEGCPE